MNADNLEDIHAVNPWIVRHPISAADTTAMTAMRATFEPYKGRMRGIQVREQFDAIVGQVTPPAGVTFSPGIVGGVAG